MKCNMFQYLFTCSERRSAMGYFLYSLVWTNDIMWLAGLKKSYPLTTCCRLLSWFTVVSVNRQNPTLIASQGNAAKGLQTSSDQTDCIIMISCVLPTHTRLTTVHQLGSRWCVVCGLQSVHFSTTLKRSRLPWPFAMYFSPSKMWRMD